jgi:hypothetical protein
LPDMHLPGRECTRPNKGVTRANGPDGAFCVQLRTDVVAKPAPGREPASLDA